MFSNYFTVSKFLVQLMDVLDEVIPVSQCPV
jgi:hypothetical protein